MALWIRIFFFPISKFLSFWRGRNGKKKGSFLYFFFILFVLREGVREWEKNENPSFFFLFVSFLPFFLWFSLFFRSIFFFGSGKRRMKFPLSLPSFLLFGGEKWEEQLEKRKEVLSIFRSFFLDFFFLKTLLFFSFSFFFGRGKRIEEIAFFAIIHFYKNTTCLSTPRIFILGQNCLAFAKHKTA